MRYATAHDTPAEDLDAACVVGFAGPLVG